MGFPKKKTFATAIILIIMSIIIIAFFSFRQSRKVDVVSSNMDYTRNVLFQLNNLYNTTIDHARAARDYSLSGKENEIQKMQSTASDLVSKLGQLRILVKERPGRQILLDSLASYIAQRIEFSNQLVTEGKEKGLPAVAELYQTGTGREYNDIMLSFIQKMQADELNTLRQDEQKNSNSLRQLNNYLIELLVFILILIIILLLKGRVDIAQRKKTEDYLKSFNLQLQEQVKEKAKELSGVFERITDGFIALDKNFCFTYVNKRAGEMTGRDPASFIGKNIWKEFEKNISPQFREAMVKAMEVQEYIYFEEYSPAYNAWFEDHLYPSPDGLSIFYRDISERKKAAELIEKEKNLSDTVINSLPGMFYFYDRSGKFIRWNKRFETVSGYNSEEISKTHPLDFFDGEDKEKIQKCMNDVFEKGSSNMEALFLSKNKIKTPYYFTGASTEIDGILYALGIGTDMTEIKKAQEELRISRLSLEKSYKEIRLLASNIENIREEEKIKIAREIHDELGQQLTGLKMDVAWLRKKLDPEQTVLQQKTTDIMALLDEVVRSVGRIASELRPGLLDDLGLVTALEWQSEEFEKRSGIKTEFRSFVDDGVIPSRLSTGFFRIYQESLTNVARHAQADGIIATLEQDNDELILQITDDGNGFDAKDIENKKTLGLLGMKERTMMMGGRYEIISQPGKGTTVVVAVPLSEKRVPEIKREI